MTNTVKMGHSPGGSRKITEFIYINEYFFVLHMVVARLVLSLKHPVKFDKFIMLA